MLNYSLKTTIILFLVFVVWDIQIAQKDLLTTSNSF